MALFSGKYEALPPFADDERVNVVIDTPKGSRNKFKYDPKHGLFMLSKVLPLGSSFPFDFGYIPGTKGDDGDAVDILVLMEEPAFTGCLLTARLIGVIEAEQVENGKPLRNDRLIGTLDVIANPSPIRSLDDVEKRVIDEIEHFFISYNQVEGRLFEPLGRRGPSVARKLVEAAK